MSARFAAGDRVRIRQAYPPGHVRTPYYIRGKEGVISRLIAEHPNPEELAYGRPGLPVHPVYWVRFRQSDLWPDYMGPAHDTADVDVQEHWLEPFEEGDRRAPPLNTPPTTGRIRTPSSRIWRTGRSPT